MESLMRLMRRTMAPVIILAGVLLRADADDSASSAFSVSRWTVKQLTRFEINDEGKLRLARGYWKLAAKRPLPAATKDFSQEDDRTRPQRQQSRTRQRRANVNDSSVARLFSRISEENGGSGITLSRGSEDWKQFSYSIPNLSGTLTEEGDALHLELHEQQDGMRILRVEDSKDTTRLHYCSADGNLLHIQRSPGGVHVGASISGRVKSVIGRTFIEIVHKHPAWFHDELQPAFQSFATLPINVALHVKLNESEAKPRLPVIRFDCADLAQEKVIQAFAPFLQFQMKGGHLRRNRFAGHSDVLEKDVTILTREYNAALQRAVGRLRKKDAPPTQIGELEARIIPLNRDPLRLADGKPHRVTLMQMLQPEDFESLGGDYRQFSLFMVAAGYSGSGNSRSNHNYSRHFKADHIRGRIHRENDFVSVSTSDQEIAIRVTEDQTSMQLVVVSEAGLLYVGQSCSSPCIATLAGGGELLALRGESLAAIVDGNEEMWHERFLPVFHRLRITGLDPFSEATVGAVLERLKSDLLPHLSDDAIVGWTESIALPLLSDVGYLNILASRLAADDRAVINKRIKVLERP